MSTILKNISKQYDQGEKVIDNISAEIQTGEFFVIVGPSGCGKSTLLRMIAGLTSISAGTIKIEDRVVNDLEPKDRNLTMVFQSYALFPFLSVWDNVAFGLKARKNDSKVINERVDNALKMVNLEELRDRKPRELSGGQRQRVALARAVASDAKICLMDEPLSNLDAQLRIKMRQEIYALQRKLGLTLIYVTHDQVEAMTMADHIMVLNDSKIQQVGTPSEIYTHPANEFVASFFGVPPINILPAKKVSDRILQVNNDFEVELSQDLTQSNVHVGVRPNELQVRKSDELHANATIKTVEYLGDQKIVHAKLSHGGTISAIVPSSDSFDAFENVEITSSNNFLLFDVNGNNITQEMEAVANA
ncbi:ABC transporter ATP-binding protein [Companilactobacillus sp.]|jgi:sn-glycerol 3-phosphate transport system ATP-binding protein|uniref:ABC transporter ATP-binding protein n=1 Tax=Companilactobacillus sp. TaxID=2767905 RepID=UPI0025BD05E9|nr:ABC transporter ATP-binding protein [Companilactobacillus sp.]MCH4009079.1 ABC transporter ATP-binding protein [Companilactobacillus sp.]MCH4050742.1 ABC transporter ATP-binding protein [Companilactobacillus sp.]MCH4077021.1 ABC transporter ATP-binding protein [Companilactobacillus sp.]MCH4125597.1 ABC transporter ATP-binding protein [Companilactobacillus sp.]MCI1311306.1 ABC transporter ATP-binding protein [Companilactobacillus sp.]